jgi:group I intron endonuclease
MNTGIYQILNLITNKFYIGSTSKKGFKSRWWQHKSSLKNNINHSIKLQRSWNKYGESNFVFKILEECLPEKCIEREQYYLDTLKPEYNIRKIAHNNTGISSWNKGKPAWNKGLKGYQVSWIKGKHHTEETIKKISLAKLGHIPWNKGILHTQEAKNNMSKNHANFTGVNNPHYGKPASAKRDLKTGRFVKK